MKKTLPNVQTIFIFLLVLLYSCKKTSNPTPSIDPATTKINAVLMAGNGTWKLGAPTTVYYDKSNIVLKTFTNTSGGYWIFDNSSTDSNGKTFIRYMAALDQPQTIEYIPYLATAENNIQYITTTSNSIKYQFKTLTTTDATIVTTNVQPLGIFVNNQSVTADHATYTLTMTKVN